MKKNKPEISAMAGAVMMEAVFVLIVFFLFAVGYMESTRYMAARNLLVQAADSTLELAQRANNLEDPATISQLENHAIKAASVSLVTKSNAPSQATLIPPGNAYSLITLPSASPGQLETKLQTVPIRVELQAQIKPIFSTFFPSLKAKAVAVGYREPRRMANNPIPRDCAGNVLGSPNFQTSYSFISGGVTYTNTQWGCTCTNTCSGVGMAPTPTSPQNCACACSSALGFQSDGAGGCRCQTGKIIEDGKCVSSPNNCPPGQLYNPNTQSCYCAGGATVQGSSCVCSDPKKVYNQTTGCVCKPAATGQYLSDATNCTYACSDPLKQLDSNGACTLCKSGWNMDEGGSCRCPNSPAMGGPNCPAGSAFNEATCECVCNDACYKADGSYYFGKPSQGQSCDSCDPCPAGQIASGRSCQCDTTTACSIPGQIHSGSNNCDCTCPPGTQVYGGQCLTGGCISTITAGCPGGIIYGSGGTCGCDE